jgi:hypothetical protein
VGGGTMFSVAFQRQPYRSFSLDSNYYVLNLIGGSVVREFPTGTNIGADLTFSLYSYNQLTTLQGAAFYRQDRTVHLQAYANLTVSKRVVFRFSIEKNRRKSNLPGAAYNNTVVFGGLVLGWT